MSKPISKAAGYNLLEMLVALLVISVGLLGVTSLQLKGQQVNHLSYVRTQATYLAYDFMDRIRANKDSKNGIYATAGNCSTVPSFRDCESQTCTWNDVAQYDLAKWCGLVQQTLPEGKAECCKWDASNFQYTFSIQWTEKDDEPPQNISWTLMLLDN